jgi:hypothetical protein
VGARAEVPDRMDALVWLMTALVIDAGPDTPDGVWAVGAGSGESDTYEREL